MQGGGEIVDLAWPSEYVPAYEPVRAHYLASEVNRRACARLFRHRGGGPRNTIVLIHGYRAGQFFVEERAFPVRWLYGLGLDVALLTLPFLFAAGLSAPTIRLTRRRKSMASRFSRPPNRFGIHSPSARL